jgi:hypothetical protein
MKPTKHCLESGDVGREDGHKMEGVNLSKVHCMHAWNYCMEIPSLMYANSKRKEIKLWASQKL